MSLNIKKHLIQKEILRKIIHLSSMWIPLIYIFFDYPLMFCLLLISTLFIITFDLLRVKRNSLGRIINHCIQILKLNNVFRKHEHMGSLSGASYMLLAALLCLIIFPREVFIAALSVLIISDTLAAFIGLTFGSKKIYQNKTLEGTVGFLLSSLLISYIVCESYKLPLFAGIVASIATTIAETYSKKIGIDDNFLIPLVYGVVFLILS